MAMMMGETKGVMKVVMMVGMATEEAVVVVVVVVVAVATEMVAAAMVMVVSLQARASVGARRSGRIRRRVGCRIGHSAVLIACPVVCGAVSVASSSASCCVYCVGMGSVGREVRAQDHHRRGSRGSGSGAKMMLAEQMAAMTATQAEAMIARAMMSVRWLLVVASADTTGMASVGLIPHGSCLASSMGLSTGPTGGWRALTWHRVLGRLVCSSMVALKSLTRCLPACLVTAMWYNRLLQQRGAE